MAKVWIEMPCDEPRDLPAVCMKCGEKATDWKKRKFQWHPPWIGITILAGLIIYVILALVLRKECTVAVPFCQKHKGHWSNRLWLTLGSFFVLVVGGIGLAILVASLVPPNSDLVGLAVLAPILAFVGWLILVVVAQTTAIRPTEITDHGIQLTGVCAEFADAQREFDDSRRSLPREAVDRWDDRRPSKRRRDSEDDERIERDNDDRRGRGQYRDDY